MVDCILRDYLRKKQDFGEDEFKRIIGNRFFNQEYQLLRSKDDPIYTVECGGLFDSSLKFNTEWHYILAEIEYSGITNVSPIVIGTNQIGWIVPITTVMDRTEAIKQSSDEDEMNNAIDRSLLGLIFSQDCFKHSDFSGDAKGTWSLLDFYDPNIGVALIEENKLPTQMLSGSKLKPSSISGLNSMLITKGFVPYDRVLVTIPFSQPTQTGSIRVSEISLDLENSSNTISWLLAHAAKDSTPVGCFFGLYQIIEMLSRMVFEVAVMLIHKTSSTLNLNYHTLNRTLGWITDKERHVRWVLERFCDSLDDDDFQDSAKVFIYEIDPNRKTKDESYQLLYAIRNKIAHSQSHWRFNPLALEYLQRVNTELMNLLQEILNSFSISRGESSLEITIAEKLAA
ncbi:MAG: hypothetical protein RTV72_12275 [Candidatus Thorarchaeota archaeon]